MKIKHTLAVAAVAAIASTGANAAWESGGTGNSANQIDAELILTVWNNDTQRSFSQDLGVTTRQFMTGEAGEQSFNLDDAGLNYIGTGDIRYSVAGNSSVIAPNELQYFGYYFTSNQEVENLPNQNFAALNAQFGGFQGYANDLGDADSGTTDNPVFFLDGQFNAASGAVWGNQLRSLTANITANAVSTSGSDTEALAGWAVGVDSDAIGNVVSSSLPFVWTLDTSADTLSYSAVPIPAAAWLFGSALLGMIGAARRRKVAKA